MSKARRALPGFLTVTALLLATVGCRQDMHDQPKYEPLEASVIFADGTSARHAVPGTVARGTPLLDEVLVTGRTPDDQFVNDLPVELDRVLLERGQDRYEAFCSPCHGRLGDGRGMVVQRGFKQPQSFHETRLRESPVGYFFNVISNGFGQMSSYASQVPVADRWAIAAYIRALQLSRHAPAAMLSEDDRQRLARADEDPQTTARQGTEHE